MNMFKVPGIVSTWVNVAKLSSMNRHKEHDYKFKVLSDPESLGIRLAKHSSGGM